MKKILLSSLVLTTFAISIILFQLSCKKDVQAETGGNSVATSAGIVLYNISKDNGTDEIWKVNIDGTGNQKVNITLPANVEFHIGDGGNYRLTADAKKIVLNAENITTQKTQLYSCNLDGSNLKLIVEGEDIDNIGDVN